jgi:uncharacterized protein (DUF433 family)
VRRPRAPREHQTLRLRPDLVEELKRHARESGVSVSALAERYIDEGLRHDHHPLVTFRDGVGGRRAALVGTRLDVAQVIETVRATEKHDDEAVREAAEYLGVTETQVRACVRYYARYRSEIDEWLERTHAIAMREEDGWRREREVLAEQEGRAARA